jgi:hypothetical protein
MSPVPDWLEADWILAAFAEYREDAQSAYRRFVAEGKSQPSPWEELKNQIFLGSARLVEEMRRQVDGNRRLSEVPRSQRRPLARPLAWYLEHYPVRDRAIFEAFRSGGYSMREIRDHVGLHYSTISRIVSPTDAQPPKKD